MTDLRKVLGGSFNALEYITPLGYTTSQPPEQGAVEHLRLEGFKPPQRLQQDAVLRFPAPEDKKPSSKSGWCVYFEDKQDDEIIGTLVYGSWKGDDLTKKWCNKSTDHMTTAQRNQYKDRVAAAQIEKEKQRAALYAKACIDSQAIWDCSEDIENTPYTIRKQINAIGARHNGSALVVPLYFNNKICSLQYIRDDGVKKFHYGGRVKDAYFFIKGKEDAVYITEGYATGVSIHMATGASVYVAFNANNLRSICSMASGKHQGARIVVCADDDRFTKGNPGIKKATEAAEANGLELVKPILGDEGTDFNDMAVQLGLEAVNQHLNEVKKIWDNKKKDEKPENKVDKVPPGVITSLYKYYMQTSGAHQPGFAIQTALSLTSVICGRYFQSDQDNPTNLYFLNVGQSATGKEHCKTIIDRVMDGVGMGNHVAGDGFTSSPAVISLLLRTPLTIGVIDEFGRYLEAANSKSMTAQKEANTAIMECIGRHNGTLRAKNYSTMTMTPDAAKNTENRYIHSPSLTLTALTTPDTLFSQLGMSSVLDGFLNRWIISVSKVKRQPRKKVRMIDMPDEIKGWVDSIRARAAERNPFPIAQEYPTKEIIYFTKEAEEIQREFELEMLDLMNELDAQNLSALAGRANEFAMRLSVNLALSRDPDTNEVTAEDMQWSVDYMRERTKETVEAVRQHMYGSSVHKDREEILRALRVQGDKGTLYSSMKRVMPFAKHRTKDLKEILQDLSDSNYIVAKSIKPKTGKGRPSIKYFALQETPDD